MSKTIKNRFYKIILCLFGVTLISGCEGLGSSLLAVMNDFSGADLSISAQGGSNSKLIYEKPFQEPNKPAIDFCVPLNAKQTWDTHFFKGKYNKMLPEPCRELSRGQREAQSYTRKIFNIAAPTINESAGSDMDAYPRACQQYIRQMDVCSKAKPAHAEVLAFRAVSLKDTLNSKVLDEAGLTKLCNVNMGTVEMLYGCEPMQ